MKFETEPIKSSLHDYSDAYILVTSDISVTGDKSSLIKNAVTDGANGKVTNTKIAVPIKYLSKF